MRLNQDLRDCGMAVGDSQMVEFELSFNRRIHGGFTEVFFGALILLGL